LLILLPTEIVRVAPEWEAGFMDIQENKTWLIRGGRVVDPVNGTDEITDLYIENGRIALPRKPRAPGVPEIDATGLLVVPGFIDLHVHFREPGNESAETIKSGSHAAARGGFTTVVTMPNTRPPADTPERITWALKQSGEFRHVSILPAGCITAGRSGKELADLRGMAEAGAVAFTDDGTTPDDEALMRRAMTVAKELRIPIMDHALDPDTADGGVMHEGETSARLGLPGIPSCAETTVVERDLALAEETGCALHIQHVSSHESVDLIRNARRRDLPVSAEVTPHHLALIDSDVTGRDANLKMNPPLRSNEDRESLLKAVAEGTLQACATDHAPHPTIDKQRGFLRAPFGVVGLETAVGLTYSLLVEAGRMTVGDWVRRWTVGPARVLNLPLPCLSVGQIADVTILDLDTVWVVDSDEFASESVNTAFEGRTLKGRAMYTFCGGMMTWSATRRK